MIENTVASEFFIFFVILWGIMMTLGVLITIFWVFMLVDVAKRDFKKENDKLTWILVVVLANWIGAIVYYFVVKRLNKH